MAGADGVSGPGPWLWGHTRKSGNRSETNGYGLPPQGNIGQAALRQLYELRNEY